MKYSLYDELFVDYNYEVVFEKSGKEFCNKLQSSLGITVGRSKKRTNFTGNTYKTYLEKTIKNEKGQEKTLKFSTSSSAEISKNPICPTEPKKREISVGSEGITIRYLDNRDNKQRIIIISDMFVEYEHGVYVVKENNLEYYDREAIDKVQSHSKKKFDRDIARSFGVLPDIKKAINFTDSLDFFVRIVVKSNKEEIDRFLGEYLSSNTRIQSL